MKSNEIWKNDSNYTNWELRQPRFEEEMRPVFFQYLGITPGSHVLDGGCGTGVFTRYLARGLKNGRITGFDICRNYVDYGNARIAEENLSDKCKLVYLLIRELGIDGNSEYIFTVDDDYVFRRLDP